MHCNTPFIKKNRFTTLVNCRKNVIGKNVNMLYLVVLSLFEGFMNYSFGGYPIKNGVM